VSPGADDLRRIDDRAARLLADLDRLDALLKAIRDQARALLDKEDDAAQ
jgi:hypothetical protein